MSWRCGSGLAAGCLSYFIWDFSIRFYTLNPIKGYDRFVLAYVTGRAGHLRLHKVYTYILTDNDVRKKISKRFNSISVNQAIRKAYCLFGVSSSRVFSTRVDLFFVLLSHNHIVIKLKVRLIMSTVTELQGNNK